ncbi:MAG: peptidylprolyl isomerase [Ginsengibacter sp.]
MKNFLLIVTLSLITSSVFSQTLFTYGSQAVSKEEFLRAFNKNNNSSATTKDSDLREYLDLYIKFKLKVKAANDLHIDTFPEINNDLQNFRTQIEESYLNDEKEIDTLVEEAFTRSQKDIHILHLFIPMDKEAAAADTIKIYQAAKDAYDVLIKGGYFKDIVHYLKDKSIDASWSDVGFITVFNIPYEFENIVYQLQRGQSSKLYRSKNGYHIFLNIEEREALGKIKVAQILIAVPPGANDEQKNKAFEIADSVYKKLQAGADFNETALTFSNDQTTNMNGGVLPEFGIGKYDPVFESKAFALQKDGEITAPFQTSFGYHILKRLSRTPVPEYKSREYLSSLKQQVLEDARISSAKEKFLNNLLKTLAYKNNTGINEKALWRITDSFIVSGKKITTANLNEKTWLHSFLKSRVTVADWLKFAKNYKSDPALNKGESYPELMKKYISSKALENYRKRLEYYNPDFKYQLQEFKDGNMLFEVMEKNIWSKASIDSAGIINFFNQNKTRYYWSESADVILISCPNEKIAKLAAEQIRSGKSWQNLSEDNASQIQTDSGRYELTQVPVKISGKFTPGTITEPIVNDVDSTASFVKIIHIYPGHQPRTLEEARGLVINDYQNLLEKKWIEELKKKYPVKVNEEVLSAMLNNIK